MANLQPTGSSNVPPAGILADDALPPLLICSLVFKFPTLLPRFPRFYLLLVVGVILVPRPGLWITRWEPAGTSFPGYSSLPTCGLGSPEYFVVC